jgi:putative membrane protein
MMNRRIAMKGTARALPLAIALAFGSGWALAQTAGSSGTPGSTTGSSVTGGKAAPAAQPGTGTRNTETRKDDKLSHGDRKFIEDAAEGGMFEVQAAQMAESKARDPAVKEFATKLVQDHQQANNELVQLANSKHVELPAAPSRGQRHAIEKLGKMDGAEFDKNFVQQVGIKDHEKDIKKFEKAADKVKDPDLKAWVQKTLPHLREHYALAEKLPESGKSNAAAMGHRGASKSGG